MTERAYFSNKRRSQRGISMIEIMVGAALMGVVIAAAMTIDTRAGDRTTGRNDADDSMAFISSAAEYFLSNRTNMEAAMQSGTNASTYCRIDVNADGTGGITKNSTTKKTCALDATQLRANNLWPANLSVDSRGGRYVAIFRSIYDTQSTPQPTGGVDMFIALAPTSGELSAVTLDGRTTDELQAAAAAMGGIGGFVPIGTLGACTATRSTSTYEACGNGWKVNLSDFIDSAELTTFANALPN